MSFPDSPFDAYEFGWSMKLDLTEGKYKLVFEANSTSQVGNLSLYTLYKELEYLLKDGDQGTLRKIYSRQRDLLKMSRNN